MMTADSQQLAIQAPSTDAGTTPVWPSWLLGILAYACYAIHAGYFIADDRTALLLWGCHLAALGVGTGLLLRSPVCNAMGLISLAFFGVPLWLTNVATGGEFLLTSTLTHFGGLGLGIVAARRMGIPRHSWLVLWLATLGLMVFCRIATPEVDNVNLAFAPPAGWEDRLPGYPVFGLIVLGGAAAQFFVGELVLRRIFGATPPAA